MVKFAIFPLFVCCFVASKKMTQLLFARYKAADCKLCLDEWTKKGLSMSFLGVSACFYNPVDSVPRHIVMRVKQIQHPHTGEMLKEAIVETLTEWNTDHNKVVMLVTDNVANVVKAMRLRREIPMSWRGKERICRRIYG